VDLLIWPETAVPVLKDQAQGYIDMMGRLPPSGIRR
jgi:apolipoprotein N-acyltransferase